MTTDAVGRPILDVSPSGAFSVTEYSQATLSGTSLPGLFSGMPLDVVSYKNPKGDRSTKFVDGDRLVRSDSCGNVSDPNAIGISLCMSPDTTHYSYEQSGEIRFIFDAIASSYPGNFATSGSHVIAYSYDTAGQVVKVNDPNSGEQLTSYDYAGRVKSTTNARLETRTNTYDALGRLTSIQTPADEENVAIVYPAMQRQPASEMAPNEYFSTFTYDSLGRLSATDGGIIGSMTTNYTYDLVGRVEEITYPIVDSGQRSTTRYEYERGYLKRVCDLGAASDCAGTTDQYVNDVSYDGLGQPETIMFPGGTRMLSYDPTTHWLTKDSFDSGPSGHYSVEFAFSNPSTGELFYDEIGNRLQVVGTDSMNDPNFGFSEIYQYDEKNRIDSWTYGGNTYDYGYDALGNLDMHAGDVQVFDDPAKPHAVKSRGGGAVNYTYDADGNVASIVGDGPTRFFDFDSANRLRCVGTLAGGCDVLKVVYDAGGNRLKEFGASGTRYYAGDYFVYLEGPVSTRESQIEIFALGQRVATKVLVGGELAKAPPAWIPQFPPWIPYALGTWTLLGVGVLSVRAGIVSEARARPAFVSTTLVVIVSLVVPKYAFAGGGGYAASSTYRWNLTNSLGTGLVQIDEYGDRVGHTVFEPFGRSMAAVGDQTRTAYGGHYKQDDVGLFYMNARWMDPAAGRFMSVDPVIRSLGWSQSHNAYSYAENNPISGNDPTGKVDESLVEFDSSWINPCDGASSACSYAHYGDGRPPGKSGPFAAVDAVIEMGLKDSMKWEDAFKSPEASQADGSSSQGGGGAVPEGNVPDFPTVYGDGSSLAGAAGYLRNIFMGEALEIAGAIVGTVFGILKGLYGIGKGILTGDLATIGRGFANLGAAAIMLRSGSASGLLHPGGTPSLTPDSGTRLNNASIWHDGQSNLATRSSAQFGWIQRAWTGNGSGLGIWGQAYRIYGTVGFGLIGAGQAALGY